MNKSYDNLKIELENDSIFEAYSKQASPSGRRRAANDQTFNLNFISLEDRKENQMENKVVERKKATKHKDKLLKDKYQISIPNLTFEEPAPSSQELLISEISTSEKLPQLVELQQQSIKDDPKKKKKRKVIATKTKVFRQINLPFKNIYKRDQKLSIQVVDEIQPKAFPNHNHVGFQMKSFNFFSSDLEHSNSNTQRIDHNWVEIGINSLKTKQETKKKRKIAKRRKRKVRCNCKNSYCIKLYCECFRKNGYCGKYCTCLNCKNVPSNEERQQIKETKSGKRQNSFIFRFNPEKDNGIKIIYKGCNCVRSGCTNGYCECFANNNMCQPGCFCRNCRNH